MHSKIDICKEIKRLLDAQGQSIRWLSEQIGCNHSTLSRKLKKRSSYSDMLSAISDVLNVCFYKCWLMKGKNAGMSYKQGAYATYGNYATNCSDYAIKM